MANQQKRLNTIHSDEHPTTWRENWQVMKPFVYFGFKAMTIIGGALISIIKLLPTLAEHHKAEEPKSDKRVIKI